ncbi:hypothetical protein ILYODFUR_031208 [Ilyodon furcidens]|uniref:Uncharacterized protein n=1 Tax=Ilyodon furcidens TaxID=33524 RepID=A0ABV0UAC2_9TELE
MEIKYFRNTSNPHILHHHPELKEVEQRVLPTTDQRTLHHFTKRPANSERAKRISKSVACFISKDIRLYSIVENEGFRFTVDTTEPQYIIPSRQFFLQRKPYHNFTKRQKLK